MQILLWLKWDANHYCDMHRSGATCIWKRLQFFLTPFKSEILNLLLRNTLDLKQDWILILKLSAEFRSTTKIAFRKIVRINSLKLRNFIFTRFTLLSQINIHISLQLLSLPIQTITNPPAEFFSNKLLVNVMGGILAEEYFVLSLIVIVTSLS